MKQLELDRSSIQYRPDIDGLRSIAIISVLILHLGFQTFSGGFVGVDVFFVISGFLITNLIKKEIETTGQFSMKQFYARRICRLLPALVVVLFFTILFSILVFSPTHLRRIGGALTSSITSISNIYFWREAGYFDASSNLKPFLHTWSLSIEEQFYLVWPSLLWGLMVIKKSWLPPTFLILAGTLSLYLNQIFGDGEVGMISKYWPRLAARIANGNATLFFLLPFRIFEFAIGALIVYFIHIKSKQWIYDLFFMMGLILIGYAVFSFDDKILFPSYYGLVPTIGTALIIYSGHKSRFQVILSNKLSVGIGLISYSLYLVHWPIIVFWTYLADSIDTKAKCIIMLMSVILAILNYVYIEQPFRKTNMISPRWKYTAIVLVVLLAYLGINIRKNNGWAWRIPQPVVLGGTNNATDFHVKMCGGAGYKGFIGNTKKKVDADIILIGDSHGRHYAEGLYKILAKNNNLNFYVSNCFSSIYLPNFTRVDNKYHIKKSSEALSKDMPYINNGNKPVIILSESWLFQMRRADMVDENGARKHIKVTAQDIIQGIYDLKEMIGDSTLIIIGALPRPRANLAEIFSRTKLWSFFDIDVDPNQYLEDSPDSNNVDFNKQLKEASKDSGKFIFLDPHDVLCENDKCRNFDADKKLIYSDGSHLSKYGSIEVIKGFMPELEKILQSKIEKK